MESVTTPKGDFPTRQSQHRASLVLKVDLKIFLYGSDCTDFGVYKKLIILIIEYSRRLNMIILLVFTEEKVISKLYFTCYYEYSKFDFTRCF